MVTLDDQEKLALKEFLGTMEGQRFNPKPTVSQEGISRGAEGQIIIPVVIPNKMPSLSLALLMGQKAEHIYKQTACRLILVQSLEKDPQKRKYVWIDNAWRPLS